MRLQVAKLGSCSTKLPKSHDATPNNCNTTDCQYAASPSFNHRRIEAPHFSARLTDCVGLKTHTQHLLKHRSYLTYLSVFVSHQSPCEISLVTTMDAHIVCHTHGMDEMTHMKWMNLHTHGMEDHAMRLALCQAATSTALKHWILPESASRGKFDL